MGGGRVSGGLKLQEFSRPKKYMRNSKNTPRYIGHENNGHETMGTTHRARNDGHETTDTEQRTRNNVHETTGKILMAKELPYFDYFNLLLHILMMCCYEIPGGGISIGRGLRMARDTVIH